MKKKFILWLLCSFFYFNLSNLQAQIAINTDNTDPDASAMLDIKSTDKGILIPRMTTAQRTTLSNPAEGLLVFDNETNSFWFFDGSNWTELVSSANSVFEHDDNNNLVKPNTSLIDIATDDFVFWFATIGRR